MNYSTTNMCVCVFFQKEKEKKKKCTSNLVAQKKVQMQSNALNKIAQAI